MSFKVHYPLCIVSGVPVGYSAGLQAWPERTFDSEIEAVKFIQDLDKHIRSHAMLHEIIIKEIDWKTYKKVK